MRLYILQRILFIFLRNILIYTSEKKKIIEEVVEKSKKWDILIAINFSETGFFTGKFIKKLLKYCKPKCKIIIEIVERHLLKTLNVLSKFLLN